MVLGLAGLLILGVSSHWAIGPQSVAGPAQNQQGGDVAALGRSVFTTYLFAFAAGPFVKVHPVPPEIDRAVAEAALAPLGAAVDTMTELQRKYADSWELGT